MHAAATASVRTVTFFHKNASDTEHNRVIMEMQESRTGVLSLDMTLFSHLEATTRVAADRTDIYIDRFKAVDGTGRHRDVCDTLGILEIVKIHIQLAVLERNILRRCNRGRRGDPYIGRHGSCSISRRHEIDRHRRRNIFPVGQIMSGQSSKLETASTRMRGSTLIARL